MSTPTEERPPAVHPTRLIPPADLAHYFALHATVPLPTTLADVVNDDARNTQYQELVTRLTADEPETTKATIRESAAYLLGLAVGRLRNRSAIPALGNLLDRAYRVKGLLEFLAGYSMLVDACTDGVEMSALRMDFLATPAGEAAEVVQELKAAVEAALRDICAQLGVVVTPRAVQPARVLRLVQATPPELDETDGERPAQPAVD